MPPRQLKAPLAPGPVAEPPRKLPPRPARSKARPLVVAVPVSGESGSDGGGYGSDSERDDDSEDARPSRSRQTSASTTGSAVASAGAADSTSDVEDDAAAFVRMADDVAPVQAAAWQRTSKRKPLRQGVVGAADKARGKALPSGPDTVPAVQRHFSSIDLELQGRAVPYCLLKLCPPQPPTPAPHVASQSALMGHGAASGTVACGQLSPTGAPPPPSATSPAAAGGVGVGTVVGATAAGAAAGASAYRPGAVGVGGAAAAAAPPLAAFDDSALLDELMAAVDDLPPSGDEDEDGLAGVSTPRRRSLPHRSRAVRCCLRCCCRLGLGPVWRQQVVGGAQPLLVVEAVGEVVDEETVQQIQSPKGWPRQEVFVGYVVPCAFHPPPEPEPGGTNVAAAGTPFPRAESVWVWLFRCAADDR